MQYSHIPLPAVTVVLIVVLLSVVFAAVIGIASLVYRNNKLVEPNTCTLSIGTTDTLEWIILSIIEKLSSFKDIIRCPLIQSVLYWRLHCK